MKKLTMFAAALLLCCGTATAAPTVPLGGTVNALLNGTVQGLVGTLEQLGQGRVDLGPLLNGLAGEPGSTVRGTIAAPLNATLIALLDAPDGQALPNLLNPATAATAIPAAITNLSLTLQTAVGSLVGALTGQSLASAGALPGL